MKIVFRVDASMIIGTGHVMRCLSLADKLKKDSYEIAFASIPQTGSLQDIIEKRGYQLISLTSEEINNFSKDSGGYSDWLPKTQIDDANNFLKQVNSADIVVIDHYAIDYKWHKLVREALNCKIVVIDDLVRVHDADLIIDQSLNRNSKDYICNSKVLAGPQYAILGLYFDKFHDELLDKKEYSLPLRIMISMGGVDALNTTLEVLKILHGEVDAIFNILVNSTSPNYDEVKNFCEDLDFVNHYDFIHDMASFMSNQDIVIGAGGTSSWERACLGLPSIAVQVADNQNFIVKQLELTGAAVSVKLDEISYRILPAFKTLQKNWKRFQQNNLLICDGRGAARVVHEIETLVNFNESIVAEISPATPLDIDLVFHWQNLPETRQFALNPDVPNKKEHSDWMKEKLIKPEDYFYIIKDRKSKTSCGVLRLDRQKVGNYLVSIYIDPLFHGKGIALSALNIANAIFSDVTFHAKVLEANIASHKLFKKAGYRKVSNEQYIRQPI